MTQFLFACLLSISHFQAEFLQDLVNKKNESCSTCLSNFTQIQEHQETKPLLVFMSFSVPLESWKDLSAQLEQTEGVFLLKGLPHDSFEELAVKLAEFRLAGVQAPIDIDPESFETYRIDAVPAIVLRDANQFDQLFGNTRLDAALQMIADRGDTSASAKQILDLMRKRPS